MFDKFRKPENIFVIFCLFWGLILSFVTPPFTNFDEPEHFYKIYAFSEGTINHKKITSYTDGTFNFDEPQTFTSLAVPISAATIVTESRKWNPYFDENKVKHEGSKVSLSKIKNLSKIPLNKNAKTLIVQPVPSYTIISYFLSCLVLTILKIFNANPLFMLYMMRLCSLFLYTGLVYYAISILPFKKWLFILIAVLPTSLYLASGISTDPLVIGLCFIFIAYVLKLAYCEKVVRISVKNLSFFFFLILLICVCKFIYFPLVFLYFLIPKEKFVSQKFRHVSFLIMFLICFCYISAFLSYTVYINKGVFSYFKSQSMLESISNIFFHPLNFIFCMAKTTYLNGSFYIKTAIADFGFSDKFVPNGVVVSYILLLFLNSFEKDKITIKNKLLFGGIIILCILLCMTSTYIIFSIEKSGIIAALKGRYLLPIMPLFFLLFSNSKIKLGKINLPPITFFASFVFLAMFVLTVIAKYY